MNSKIQAAFWVMVVGSQLCGCGQNRQETNEALKFFGITYYNYHAIWKRPPESWEDVFTLANGPALEGDRKMLLLAQKSKYVVVWGVDPKTTDATEVVLAYHPDSLIHGGDVLFLDGSIRKLSGAELANRVRPPG